MSLFKTIHLFSCLKRVPLSCCSGFIQNLLVENFEWDLIWETGIVCTLQPWPVDFPLNSYSILSCGLQLDISSLIMNNHGVVGLDLMGDVTICLRPEMFTFPTFLNVEWTLVFYRYSGSASPISVRN